MKFVIFFCQFVKTYSRTNLAWLPGKQIWTRVKKKAKIRNGFFTSQSTAMVMSRWSVDLTTLLLGELDLAVNQYFVHTLSLPFLNQWKKENDRVNCFMINFHEITGTGPGSNLRPLNLQSDMLLTALRGHGKRSGEIQNTCLSGVRVVINGLNKTQSPVFRLCWCSVYLNDPGFFFRYLSQSRPYTDQSGSKFDRGF